jgi:hypothetical protein
MMNEKEFVFNTGVKPYNHNPPAGMAFMKGFRDSGNGVFVIPFTCKNVPENITLSYTSDEFKKDTDTTICREIYNSVIKSKYAHFIKN